MVERNANGEPITETEGSSSKTAWAVGLGAVAGAVLLPVLAPVVLPIVGLGAAATAITAGSGAVIGAVGGWFGFGKK